MKEKLLINLEIVTKIYYGNTLGSWFVTLLIIVASVFVATFLYWISGHVVRRLTSKTKTRLDDIISDMIGNLLFSPCRLRESGTV